MFVKYVDNRDWCCVLVLRQVCVLEVVFTWLWSGDEGHVIYDNFFAVRGVDTASTGNELV